MRFRTLSTSATNASPRSTSLQIGFKRPLSFFPRPMNLVTERLERALGSRTNAMAILRHHTSTAAFGDELGRYLAALRLGLVRDRVSHTMAIVEASNSSLSASTIQVLRDFVGNPKSNSAQLERVWSALLAKLRELRSLAPSFAQIADVCDVVAQQGAPAWSQQMRSVPATADADPSVPTDWQSAWDWAANLAHLERIGAASELASLHQERLDVEKELRDAFAKLVKERTFFKLASSMKGTAKAALRSFADIIRRLAGAAEANGQPSIDRIHGARWKIATMPCRAGSCRRGEFRSSYPPPSAHLI